MNGRGLPFYISWHSGCLRVAADALLDQLSASRGMLIGIDVILYLEWPAMLVTLVAAWLVTSRRKSRRLWGFRAFILSNLLWIVWGWFSHAFALIILQVGLFLINWRGTERQQSPE